VDLPVTTTPTASPPPSRFLTFDRTAWARLRDATPLTLKEKELEALRAGLDRIDESLLHGLRDRLACSVEMADVRRRSGMPGLDPARAGAIQRRTARFAAENGIDEDFLRRVYHLIMEESRRLQDAASVVRR
jgi:chorismate mutase